MDPTQDNQDPYNQTSEPNNVTDSSYAQEIQQIVNPVNPNPMAPGSTTNAGLPKLVKIANLLGNISLITWLFPLIGLIVSVVALVLGIQTKKSGDKRASIRVTVAIIGLVLSLACSGAVGYLAYDRWSKDDSATSITPYPEETRSAYLTTCMEDNDDEVFCNCMLTALEQGYTIDEYNALDQTFAETGELPEEYLELIDTSLQTCAESVMPTVTPSVTPTTETNETQ